MFENEGAHVESIFTYDNGSLSPKMTWDLLPALKSGNEDWHAEAERYLNSDRRLRSIHKVCHQANNIADAENSDKSEYDPNDDVEGWKPTASNDSDFITDINIDTLPHLGLGDPLNGTFFEPRDFEPSPPQEPQSKWEDDLLYWELISCSE
ncbi:hypothetical protein J4E91_006126 [Alternaria rosae]|nr:hypothetical protein J4E91_006126 [Alternaria rosae]